MFNLFLKHVGKQNIGMPFIHVIVDIPPAFVKQIGYPTNN